MRKTFLDILQDKNTVDYEKEYQRLRYLFYEHKSDAIVFTETMYSYINDNFLNFQCRKNAISLKDFENENDIPFKTKNKPDDIDEMILFCEYVSTFCEQISNSVSNDIVKLQNLLINQISNFMDSIGYCKIKKNAVVIFVPKEPAAIEVAEQINDNDVSFRILCYNHYSLKGNLDEKRQILDRLAHKLEPNEKELEKINLSLKKHLFGAFNNLNIRHNNLEAKDGDYNEKFAQLTDEKKEEMYDSLYKDCLIAFLELENNSKRCEIKDYYKK